jgi:hypothetical protein
MTRQPFQPFRVILSSGEKYEVTNHDAALVTRNWLEIGINTDKEGIAESVARCSILRIAQIEDLQTA